MANTEESNPLLEKQQVQPNKLEVNNTHNQKPASVKSVDGGEGVKKSPETVQIGWTADGLPLGHASVVGEPMRDRAYWDSSLCACLGRNDEFCSSDLEVCECFFFLFLSSFFLLLDDPFFFPFFFFIFFVIFKFFIMIVLIHPFLDFRSQFLYCIVDVKWTRVLFILLLNDWYGG